MRLFANVVSLAFVVLLSIGGTSAAEKKKAEKSEAAAETPATNACGCFQAPDGTCRCLKKSKCGCPGECEPAGCEEKRQKQMEKEAQNEIKRQQETEKKRNADIQKRREEQDEKEAESKRKR
jgi:hypothetical protein